MTYSVSDKPKGLDLSKLLKKNVPEPAPEPVAEAPAETPAAPAPGKLNLGKLLKRDTQPPTPATEPPVSQDATARPLQSGVQAQQPAVGQPAAPTGAPPPAKFAAASPSAAKPTAAFAKPSGQKPGVVTALAGGGDPLDALFGRSSGATVVGPAATSASGDPLDALFGRSPQAGPGAAKAGVGKPAPKPVAKAAAPKPPDKPSAATAKPAPQTTATSSLRPDGSARSGSVSLQAQAQANVAAPLVPAGSIAGVSAIDTAQSPMRFAAKVEDVASQQGVKRLRLDVTIGDERKYPRGYFGVDELFLGALDWANIARTKAFRIPGRHKAGYSVHLSTFGQSADKASIVWDGNDVTLHMHEFVGEPSAERSCPTEAFIDVVRGTLNCHLLARVPGSREAGNRFLLHCIGLHDGTKEENTLAAIMDAQEERREWRRKLRQASSDPADYFSRMYEDNCSLAATGFKDPYFVRFRFQTEPYVELLFHFENQRLNIFRGKAGETLVEGAAEVEFSPTAARAFFEGEADLIFLARAGQVKVTGDLNLLNRANILSTQTVANLRYMEKTGAVVSEANLRYVELVKGPLYDAFGDVIDFGG